MAPKRTKQEKKDAAKAFKEKQILADWKVRLQRGLRPTKEQQEVLDRHNKDLKGSSLRNLANARKTHPTKLQQLEKKKDVAIAKKKRKGAAADNRADFKSKTEEEKIAIKLQSRARNRRKNRS
jgi:hypothetical protein